MDIVSFMDQTNHSRWKKINAILDEALQFEKIEQQQEFIKNVCHHNRELHNQLKTLLDSIHKAKAINYLENN